MDCVVHERDGRHRNSGTGFSHDPGAVPGQDHCRCRRRLCGLAQLVQHGRTLYLVQVSDYIGRKNTYYVFFVLGAILYYLAPRTGISGMNSVPLFVIISAVIVSMYGGGFATVPAYLRDLFGTMEVGAIHGRLLTAWSAAGIFWPVLVNYIREYEKNHGVPLADSYSTVLYVMVGLLIVGLAGQCGCAPGKFQILVQG